MAINTAIKTDIAFKRLAGGKSITNPAFSPAGEPIASNVQTSADRLFGETIPTNPGISTLFDTASGGIVQLVEFDVVAINGSTYNAEDTDFLGQSSTSDAFNTVDDVDNGAAGATTHSFALQFPSDYTSQGGTPGGASQNPKAGTGFFQNGFALTGSNGQVQLVPEFYGSDYRPRIFAGGQELFIASDAQDFYIDTYAGVLFRQDGTDSSNQVPTKVRAFVYIGKMVSESLSDPIGQSTLQDVTTNGNTTTNTIIISGSATGMAVNGGDALIVSGGKVDFGMATSISGSQASFFSIQTTDSATVGGTIEVNGNATVGGNLGVTGNTTIDGTLTVNGTLSSINTTNTQVEDQFILLGSASNAALDGTRDGGIIVSRMNQADTVPGQFGTAFFYDASRQAWGISGATGSHNDTTNLVQESGDNSHDSQVTVSTIEINNNGNPLETNRFKPLHGKDDFSYGQFYVDNNNDGAEGYGDLYVYLPGTLG